MASPGAGADIRWTSLDPASAFAGEFITLLCEALEPYLSFVYQDVASARFVLERLFASGESEFAARYTRVAVHAATEAMMGWAIWLTGKDLRRERLRGGLLTAGLPMVRGNQALRDRMRAAAGTLAAVATDDFYLGNVAVAPAFRGRGLLQHLIDDGRMRARDAGCKRLVLDVSATREALVARYTSLGFAALGQGEAVDPITGARLTNIHMACPVE